MCYNCGCGIPQDDMGHPDNITDSTLEDLAKTSNKTIAAIKGDLKKYLQGNLTDNTVYEEMFKKAAKAWGQSVDDAKHETLHLLNR